MKEKETKEIAHKLQSMLAENFNESYRRSHAVLRSGIRFVEAFFEEDGEWLEVVVCGNATNMELPNVTLAIKSSIDTGKILEEVRESEEKVIEYD